MLTKATRSLTTRYRLTKYLTYSIAITLKRVLSYL